MKLTENQIRRIVRKVIVEQVDYQGNFYRSRKHVDSNGDVDDDYIDDDDPLDYLNTIDTLYDNYSYDTIYLLISAAEDYFGGEESEPTHWGNGELLDDAARNDINFIEKKKFQFEFIDGDDVIVSHGFHGYFGSHSNKYKAVYCEELDIILVNENSH